MLDDLLPLLAALGILIILLAVPVFLLLRFTRPLSPEHNILRAAIVGVPPILLVLVGNMVLLKKSSMSLAPERTQAPPPTASAPASEPTPAPPPAKRATPPPAPSSAASAPTPISPPKVTVSPPPVPPVSVVLPPTAAEQPQATVTSRMPNFPWPPPQPSARVVLPPDAFGTDKNFGELSSRLDRALIRNGYVEKSYYAVPNGIGIVTRLEHIYPDGRSFERDNRWLTQDSYLQNLSLAAYLKALFTASEGYYRVIVFVVTDVPFAAGAHTLTSDGATSLLSHGFNMLTSEVSSQSLPANYACTSLIYEFRREQGKDPAQLVPSRLDAKTHLVVAGFWTALGMQP